MTDEQLRELIGLIEGADSVELKLTVPDEDRRSTVVALGMDPLDAYIRQVFFFDTPTSLSIVPASSPAPGGARAGPTTLS